MPYELRYCYEGKDVLVRGAKDKRSLQRAYRMVNQFMTAYAMDGQLKKYYISPDRKTRELIE